MRSKRFKKVVGALAVGVLAVSISAVTAHSASAGPAKEVASGKATGLIDSDGNISVTDDLASADGAKASVDLTGVLAPGSGIGKRTVKVKTVSDDQGAFSLPFQTKQASGTVSGSVGQPGGTPPTTSNLTVNINCDVSYPPLSIKCTITISWSAA